jgi:tRNA uridine 5-carboxymethylaminomethyl modification enzyme
MEHSLKYNAIIVGAGHAGIEASLACSRMGLSTLVITINLDKIGCMPCNPSTGGPAKGHITREIDALGGEQAIATDATTIHLRMLNTGKGPAVQALRAQVDRKLYESHMRNALESQQNLDLLEGEVKSVIVESGKIVGVVTNKGDEILADGVIITTGTFLNGLIFMGEKRIPAGMRGEPPASGLSDSLRKHGIDLQRLKTGTVPRIDIDTIDYSHLEEQPHDPTYPGFSFLTDRQNDLQKVSCYITRTTESTRKVIMENLNKAALYSGDITGVGPRYCPSIEDKYHKFPEKISHPVFLEREGLNVKEVYLQGLSTSLPEDVQIQYVRTIPGLESAEIIHPGYAIEYDFSPPTQILPTFETKQIENLYFAGQINGTSGYEEAGSQGLMAGINLALKFQKRDPLILDRATAYIGILSDDITTRGTSEPYRMFTSRAEYRLLLRHDNADFRLTTIGRDVGLVDDHRWERFNERHKNFDELMANLESRKYTPVELGLEDNSESPQKTSLKELLRRPELKIRDLINKGIVDDIYKPDLFDTVEVEIKYEGYLKRQTQQAEKMRRWENVIIPKDFNYDSITGLSFEGRMKFKKIQPHTIGQAGRIEGVRSPDVWLLIVNLEKK